MQRIVLSLALISIVTGALVYGGTAAFFSDVETSEGNTFTAGAIDLKIDNESYYNGEVSPTTSWTLVDLTVEKFFNFLDLKPDDYGEDTISLHVDTNDAYLCANVTLTSNDENDCTEPEGETDSTCDDPGPDQGELAGLVNFLWWADDGDNVLEDDEEVITTGNFGELGVGNSYPLTLADSDENIWDGEGPVDGDTTVYVGKAWCFGTIEANALAQDGSGELISPDADNNGNLIASEPEDGGFMCDGSTIDNNSQTDSLTADITFEAFQARHNDGFQCPTFIEPEPEEGTVTITKIISGGPDVSPAIFSFTINDGSATAFEGDATNEVTVEAGTYDVEESPVAGYTTTYSSVNGATCDDLVVGDGANVTCTITNTFVPTAPTTITIEKIVDGGQAVAADFDFEIDEVTAALGSNVVTPGAHVVNEVNVPAEYTPTYSGGCDAEGNITAVSNTNVTCTITNTFEEQEGTLTITKIISGGPQVSASAFSFQIDGGSATAFEGDAINEVSVAPGTYDVTEVAAAGYTTTYSSVNGANCNDLIVADDANVTCTVTNTFVPPATTTILTESFGTGTCLQDIPGWDEDPGESCTNGTVAAAVGTGDNTASPDGGRFALIGNNGYICKSINATGLKDLQISYYWRGDSDGEVPDAGQVLYATGGTCASPTGSVSVASHSLTSTSTWQSNTVNLPGSLNNTTFFVRFFSGSNAGTESFRVDGLSFTGMPI